MWVQLESKQKYNFRLCRIRGTIILFTIVGKKKMISVTEMAKMAARLTQSVTQLLIPTHAHFHWLKFIKIILKNSYMFRSTTIIRELKRPCQSYYYLNTVICMLSVVVWQHIILL